MELNYISQFFVLFEIRVTHQVVEILVQIIFLLNFLLNIQVQISQLLRLTGVCKSNIEHTFSDCWWEQKRKRRKKGS